VSSNVFHENTTNLSVSCAILWFRHRIHRFAESSWFEQQIWRFGLELRMVSASLETKLSVLWKTMEDVASRRGFHQQNIPLLCGARCSTNQHFIMRCHYIDVFQVLVNKAQFAAQRFPTLLFHNTGMVLIVSCAMNVCASSIQRLVGSLLSITEAATRHQNRHLS